MASSETRAEVLILGGGFAGLAAATALAEGGARATVLEKKPHLGGRAYSFKDPRTGETVDNGQHLFMGCYRETRAFLRRIGTGHLLRFPRGLRVDYADMEGRRDCLRCPPWLPAPLHLGWGVFGLSGVSWREKLGLRNLDRYMRARCLNGGMPRELDRMTVRQWLDSVGQSRRIQERVFDPIALGALNELPERASALGFAQVLREIFYRDEESSRLGFAAVGLSELYAGAARAYVESRGGKVLPNRKVAALRDDGGRGFHVGTDRGETFSAGTVISALPPWALRDVRRPGALGGAWTSVRATPILGINLWLDRQVVREPLVGLLGAEVHWVFNKSELWGAAFGEAGRGRALSDRPGGSGAARRQYLSLVVSGAHRRVGDSPQTLRDIARADMARCFPEFEKAKIISWSVIKEPFATPSPACGTDAARPAHVSPLPHFYYAGDWTQPGLPATIESAVASGHACARHILGAGLRGEGPEENP